ncbi:hypothetical protein U9M48_023097 [Paspalum notatum var. saurae]|uniref:MLO-like protein n=1 Tax=Paspalum notatum var. saurae TaxID=547442 RepID=A0AAQ3TKY8_PASNO
MASPAIYYSASASAIIGLLLLHLMDRLSPLPAALHCTHTELMQLGFISLLLNVFQGATQKICVRENVMHHLLPCPRDANAAAAHYGSTAVFFAGGGVMGGTRRLLAGEGASSDYCLSRTRNWKQWEEKTQQNNDNGMCKNSNLSDLTSEVMGSDGKYSRSFFKQFYGSVTEEDYTTLQLGFVMKHCRGHPKFNFYNYMNRALEGDFKKVVGISWYLWGLLMVFLLLNVNGWYVYIWISIVPFILLLVVGSKMEHIITELALEVAQKHTTIEGDLVVAPSDELFWFHQPKLVLLLIHIVLFQNAFQIAFFFWLLVIYGFKSCIMGKPAYVIARLVISVISQLLCGYSTLPLYALISQMGSSFKKAMFDENISEGLTNWAQNARKRNRIPARSVGDNSPDGEGIQMTNTRRESAMEEGTARLMI